MTDQPQLRRKDVVDLSLMEHNQKLKGIPRKEEDHQQLQLRLRNPKIHLMMNKHLQSKEEGAGQRVPRKKWLLLEQRAVVVVAVRGEVVADRARTHLRPRKMLLLLRRNKKMKKRKRALTSKLDCSSYNSLLV